MKFRARMTDINYDAAGNIIDAKFSRVLGHFWGSCNASEYLGKTFDIEMKEVELSRKVEVGQVWQINDSRGHKILFVSAKGAVYENANLELCLMTLCEASGEPLRDIWKRIS